MEIVKTAGRLDVHTGTVSLEGGMKRRLEKVRERGMSLKGDPSETCLGKVKKEHLRQETEGLAFISLFSFQFFS